MIWYLLYMFRGTTEPPVLDPKHPLRHLFTRYGYQAARHPVITLLISVAAAVSLIYPFPFLYTNDFTSGASNLPHHVWTSAQPYEGDPGTRADVAMRSIWVHGSYMKALEPHVLQSALEIQDELLGPTMDFDPQRPVDHIPLGQRLPQSLTLDMRDTFHAINGLTNESWFFHSPLQYWSCSSESIANDIDILETVNKRSRQATSVNVTLRHSIVFSGKRFEDHRLVAADALVITLLHMLDSTVGRQWELRAEEIARRNSGNWRLYPSDGHSRTSTLYEFRFQPLSFQDDIFLAVAYAIASLYFLGTLSKLRALKSRLGLILAVATQIGVSIVSSFTICAVYKVDLSKIPREAYPLVILTVGLENILRFINAVIATPAQSSTAVRMGDALGQTGHIALASVSQNLFILWLLTHTVSQHIKGFCTFAAIAITFDFFYMLTFFSGVLSVELRRTELSDSLIKAASRGRRTSQPAMELKQSWSGHLLRGFAPFSTRVAGTIVMVGFVLIAQWHFFDNESFGRTALRVLRLLRSDSHPPKTASLLSVDINQARTPTAWLRMQDHETAHEVIQVIKPNANSYVARVYDPLIFVLNDADRTRNNLGVRRFLPAAYDFVRHQSKPLFITVLVCVAALSLLMNYLLWDEMLETDEDDGHDDVAPISIKTLNQGHSLDIVLIAASKDGMIATVGLDRLIRIWDVRQGSSSSIVQDPVSEVDPFPILALTIDSNSAWLAILSATNRILLWNIPEKKWGPIAKVDISGRIPVAFFFGHAKTGLIHPVLLIGSNGTLTQMHMDSKICEERELLICRRPIVSARRHFEKQTSQSPDPWHRIITCSRRGCIHIATQIEADWISRDVNIPASPNQQKILSVVSVPIISSFLAIRDRTVDLVDIETLNITHTFQISPMKRDTLRCYHSTRRRSQCGSVGLASLTLAYTSATTGDCTIQTYSPQQEGHTICFSNSATPGSETCCPWQEAMEHRYTVENPGCWEALQVGYIVGVRKLEASSVAKNMTPPSIISPLSGLRRRKFDWNQFLSHQRSSQMNEDEETWEAWCISAKGEQSTVPLFTENEIDHLLVGNLCPIEIVGRKSVAIGFGNVVKVITVGSEKFDGQEENSDDGAFVGMTTSGRRKRPGNKRKTSD